MNSYGLNTLTFGVPTLTGYVVQSYNLGSKCALVVPVANESGVIVQRRYDDVTTEISVEAVFAGATVPTPGQTFVYNTIEYEVQTVDTKGSNKEDTTVTIKGIVSQGVTLG
jgi:hypothetical protein